MRATVSIFAVLAIALTVQAKPQDGGIKQAKVNNGTEFAKGQEIPVTPIIASQGNDCGTATDIGVLPAPCCSGIFGWDTTSATDNFDNGGICSATSYATGAGGQDEVVKFQVEAGGIWDFWTCGYAGWDTTLQVFDGTAGCPDTPAEFAAQAVGCDGDGCGAPYFESDMYVALQEGVDYYLVLDAWASWYYGSAIVVFYQAAPFCSNDAFCDDGNPCNGAETCDFQFGAEGLCEAGPGSPCETYQSCVPLGPGPMDYDCVNPDPCMAYYQHDQNSTYFGPAVGNGYDILANEIAYRVDAGRELVSYSYCISGRGECEFNFTTSLWTVDPTDGANGCLPLAMIPGTECAHHQLPDPGGTPCHPYTCDKSGGGIILPDNPNDPFAFADERCGIDVYMAVLFEDTRVYPADCTSQGPGLAAHLPTVGSSPFVAINPQPAGGGAEAGRDIDTGEWGLAAWADPSVSDFANSDICTIPVGACCYDDGGCDLTEEADCTGTFAGLSTLPDPHSCLDPDGDGFYNTCDNCPDVANPAQADCNGDGEGDLCEADAAEQDLDGDGCCNGVDGCPIDPLKCAPGQCGCGVEDIDSDGDGVANCVDGCPLDARKTAPGCCGCGFLDPDVDGDGFFECAPGADVQGDGSCVDTCPMVDDAVFGPCDPGVIPTVSEWGLVIMALLLLVAGKVYFGRRTALG